MSQSRRIWSFALALATLPASMIGGARAADVAEGLEPVATVPVPASTHLEFMTRTIEGVERVFALQGSRSAETAPATQPGGGLNVIDITQPEAPAFVARVPCLTGNLDVAVVRTDVTIVWRDPLGAIEYDTLIAMATNSTGGCPGKTPENRTVFGGSVTWAGVRKTPVPGQMLTVDYLGRGTGSYPKGGHTVVAHPTEPVVYVASQETPDRYPSVEILDVGSWPPVRTSVALPQTGVSPHDITFKPDGTRAYVSSINLSFVWDTSGDKLFAPETIAVISSPNLKVHHESNLHPNGRHLLITDETLASSAENVPVCPGGGIHVFDLGPDGEFERAPVLVGQFYANEQGAPQLMGDAADQQIDIACTAHEFNFAPDGTWMPMGWFAAGVRMLDLSALQAAAAQAVPTPVTIVETGRYMVDQNDVWAAKVHPRLPGYVFASDTTHGFKVLRIAP